MKILIMLMLMLNINGSMAFASQNNEELFSPEQNVKIVKAIDYICGDIWCEGYYEYRFWDISCNKADQSCDLRFQFKEAYNNRVQYSPVQVCHVNGISSFDQVMVDDQYLHFDFINKLNNCFEPLAEAYYHSQAH